MELGNDPTPEPEVQPKADPGPAPNFEFDYEGMFLEILTEIFAIQNAASKTAETVKVQLQQQGESTEFDTKVFEATVLKATEVLTQHWVLLGLGLGSYLDEAMSHFIADKYARKDLSSAHLQQKFRQARPQAPQEEAPPASPGSEGVLAELRKSQEDSMRKVQDNLAGLMSGAKSGAKT